MVETITLYKCEGRSDKVYSATLDGGVVRFAHGRRGSTLRQLPQVTLSPEAARKTYEQKIAEKVSEGYSRGEDSTPLAQTTTAVSRILPMLLNPITADEAEKLLADPLWFMQQKADGVRAIVQIDDGVSAMSRTGKPVTLTAEIACALAKHFRAPTILDSESCGNTLVIFDVLRDGLGDLRDYPCGWRIDHMEAIAAGINEPCLYFIQTTRTEEEKRAALAILRAGGAEGVVFKQCMAPYTPDRPNSGGMALKRKFVTSASVTVTGPVDGKRSVYIASGDGLPVGSVGIPEKHGVLPAAGTVLEVEYLYAMRGGSLIQPIYKSRRDDVEADHSASYQYKAEARV